MYSMEKRGGEHDTVVGLIDVAVDVVCNEYNEPLNSIFRGSSRFERQPQRSLP
jgi:hypothetical protein